MRLGVTVGVVVTDTRPCCAATRALSIGSATNCWSPSEVATADEIAAAADLVKGKLTAIPAAVVRRLSSGVATDTASSTPRAPIAVGGMGGCAMRVRRRCVSLRPLAMTGKQTKVLCNEAV